jgi:hypothetical protein
MADAGKQVYLGKYREEDNEDAASRRKDFQVNRRERHSGIQFHHLAQ